ncbi:hypothetical protein RvY_14167 [Ramazzottius varieornatus]|uniref:Uncharacterized protein n=1 Tax=Ramazzottius varieornatus TaxID=947166 RepID=A0A1D1VQD2_RAMVA|nr:hypothetical protein RvY_14167 [Ramazzottius varieornatus]
MTTTEVTPATLARATATTTAMEPAEVGTVTSTIARRLGPIPPRITADRPTIPAATTEAMALPATALPTTAIAALTRTASSSNPKPKRVRSQRERMCPRCVNRPWSQGQPTCPLCDGEAVALHPPAMSAPPPPEKDSRMFYGNTSWKEPSRVTSVWKADKQGKVVFTKTARNFNPSCSKAEDWDCRSLSDR